QERLGVPAFLDKRANYPWHKACWFFQEPFGGALKLETKEKEMAFTMTNHSYQTNEKPIRRVIRRRNSQEDFAGPGWTDNPDEARVFADSLEAAQVCAAYGLVGMEIALRVTGVNSDLFSAVLC